MIIDTYNAYTSFDIDGVDKCFQSLSLLDLPGENVSDLVTRGGFA